MDNIIPRGIRNNNPLNLRHSKTAWQGQAVDQTDTAFVTFNTPVDGLRAAMKILLTYYGKHNLSTVWEMINGFAPPSENKTDIYAMNVAKHMGVGVNDEVNIVTNSDMMIKMVQGMILQENGSPSNFPNWIYKDEPFWYNQAVYISAWNSLKQSRGG